MGERKGQNKYYPPDFDYKKHKSLAGYHGEHPLRERAKKISQGILVIRFEMPYNIWCGGCGNHIGMGVRYNAEKSKIGNYYTTPIYKFRMKCHLCPNYIEIKTDPAAHDYVIISGARRKEQRWDPKENEQIVPEDRATHKKIELDAMYRLEHGTEDKAKLKAAVPGVAQIAEHQSTKKEDYLLNQLARQKFRSEKKALTTVSDLDAALLSKSSLNIALVDENKEDIRFAQLLKYRTVSTFDERQKQKREEIESRSLFSPNPEKPSLIMNTKGDPSTTNSKHQHLENIRKRLGLPSPHAQTFTLAPNVKKTVAPNTLGIVPIRKSEKDSQNKVTRTSTVKDVYSVTVDSGTQEGNLPENITDRNSEGQTDTEVVLSPEVTMETHSSCQWNEPEVIKPVNTQWAPGQSSNNALSVLGATYDSSSTSGSEDDEVV